MRSKLVRASIGALLNAQDRTEALIAKAVSEHVDAAASELARRHKAERERTAAFLTLLLMRARQMVPSVKSAIVAGRTGARQAAVVRVTDELRAAGVDPTSVHQVATRPLVSAAKADREHEDELHAQGSAESLASQWRGVAIAATALAIRKDRDPVKALSDSARVIRPRIERTASTETALAYSDEHEHAVLDAIRYDSEFAEQLTELRVMQEWSAMIDACPNCWPLDGVRVGIGESFPGGAYPGAMHPRCRCIAVLVTEVQPMRLAA